LGMKREGGAGGKRMKEKGVGKRKNKGKGDLIHSSFAKVVLFGVILVQ